MSTPTVILASTSPYRRQAMDRIGVACEQIAPNVDEDAFKADGRTPVALAEFLAKAKAESVAAQHPEAIVIGSDQLVDFKGAVLGKPGSAAAAVEQLSAMSGHSHLLITAMHVIAPEQSFAHCDITTLTMRELEREDIIRYVERDQPVDCAGSYRIEGAGISLFSLIDSADHSAITGLPLITLTTILRRLGIPICASGVGA